MAANLAIASCASPASSDPVGFYVGALGLRAQRRRFLAEQGQALVRRAAANYGAEGFGPALSIADPDGDVIELKGAATSAADPGDA